MSSPSPFFATVKVLSFFRMLAEKFSRHTRPTVEVKFSVTTVVPLISTVKVTAPAGMTRNSTLAFVAVLTLAVWKSTCSKSTAAPFYSVIGVSTNVVKSVAMSASMICCLEVVTDYELEGNPADANRALTGPPSLAPACSRGKPISIPSGDVMVARSAR